MDSRAKQRLTGAVILVALFVLLVPELLTGPKTASTAPIDEQGERRVVFDVETPKPAAPATPTAEPPVNLAAPSAAATERAVPGEAAAPAPETEPKPSTPARTTPPPAERPPVQARTPTPAPAATTTAPSAASPTASRAEPRSYVVQLGSFGVRDNAERLVRDMTAKGFTTFITPTTTSGRQLYQVRVGPTRDRASAEVLAARLKREGQSGSIVPIP
jgi:DedD protein